MQPNNATDKTLSECLAEIGVSHCKSPIAGYRTLYASQVRGRQGICLCDFTAAEAWAFLHQARAAA
jgi:hypothetical protein